MGQIVIVTNITDGTGVPQQAYIYSKKLDPGESVKMPAHLINSKVRKLEEANIIAIGTLPSWYTQVKAKKGKELTPDQIRHRFKKPSNIPPPPPPLVMMAPTVTGPTAPKLVTPDISDENKNEEDLTDESSADAQDGTNIKWRRKNKG